MNHYDIECGGNYTLLLNWWCLGGTDLFEYKQGYLPTSLKRLRRQLLLQRSSKGRRSCYVQPWRRPVMPDLPASFDDNGAPWSSRVKKNKSIRRKMVATSPERPGIPEPFHDSWRLPDMVIPLGGYSRCRLVLGQSPPTGTCTLQGFCVNWRAKSKVKSGTLVNDVFAGKEEPF